MILEKKTIIPCVTTPHKYYLFLLQFFPIWFSSLSLPLPIMSATCTRRLSWPPSSSPRFSYLTLSLSMCSQVSQRFAAVLLHRRASLVLAVCLCYLAPLPSSFRLGRSASGLGWVCAKIDDGAAEARSGLGWIVAGEWRCLPTCAGVCGGGRCSHSLRWRRPSGTATRSLRWRRPPGTATCSLR